MAEAKVYLKALKSGSRSDGKNLVSFEAGDIFTAPTKGITEFLLEQSYISESTEAEFKKQQAAKKEAE